MRRRWSLWFVGILVLALIMVFPLRLAIGRLVAGGFTARQVAGTIWYGRIGELHMRGQRLGTFEARLSPLALLTGSLDMDVNRLDDPHGPLSGAIVSGGLRGVRALRGKVAVAGLFGALPLDALQFEDLTLLFRGEQCEQASGRVIAIIATPIPGLDSAGALSGSARCEQNRVRLTMVEPSGTAKIELLVRSNGGYRGWMTVTGAPGAVAAGLATAGFRPTSEGMMLSAQGQL